MYLCKRAGEHLYLVIAQGCTNRVFPPYFECYMSFVLGGDWHIHHLGRLLQDHIGRTAWNLHMICSEDPIGHARFSHAVFFVLLLIFHWGFHFLHKMFHLIVKGYLLDVLANCHKRCLDVIAESADFLDVLSHDQKLSVVAFFLHRCCLLETQAFF